MSVLLFLLTKHILAVIYPGRCPRIYSDRQLPCELFLKTLTTIKKPPPQPFIPIYQLPTDNSTLNVFYNPFPNMNCLRIYVECYEITSPSLVIGCEENRCELHTLDLTRESTYFQTKSLRKGCWLLAKPFELVMQWFKEVGTGKDFLLIWGCRDLDSERVSKIHEEGAWVLKAGDETRTRVNHSGLLEKTMKMLEDLKSSAVASDFVQFPSKNECNCVACSDQQRCDECLYDIERLKDEVKHFAKKIPQPSYKNVVKKEFACNYEQLSVKLRCFLHQITKFLFWECLFLWIITFNDPFTS